MSAFSIYLRALVTFSIFTTTVCACGSDGGDPPVATTSSALSRDGAAACPIDECKGQAVACALGAQPVNVRCVPDPNAGAGSDPVGHCLLMADCPTATRAQ